MMSLTIHMALLGGVVVAVPVMGLSTILQARRYGDPRHLRRLFLFMLSALLSAAMGVAFAYWVLLPAGLGFLLRFGAGVATPTIKISEYMDLVLSMFFWLAIIFELPLGMFLLAKFRIISHKGLRRFRKYVPAAAFILAAILTPTFDVVNQTLLAVPMILLYEAGIFLAWLARPRN